VNFGAIDPAKNAATMGEPDTNLHFPNENKALIKTV
jgi:hypothetical protein